MCTQHRLGLTVVVALVLVAMPLVAAAEIAGRYSCRGTNPNGSPYSGTTVITENGGGYLLRWTIGGKTHSGTGILTGGQLSASWGVRGGAFGVVVYVVKDDGRLVGKWINPSGGNLGTETLRPR